MVGIRFTPIIFLMAHIANGFVASHNVAYSDRSTMGLASQTECSEELSRRSVISGLGTALVGGGILLGAPKRSLASGGATAGGAYLLSVSKYRRNICLLRHETPPKTMNLRDVLHSGI